MTNGIYIIRHGVTAWNLEGKLQGEADIPLSEKGTRQATTVANSLSDIALSRVYCSPLGRAVSTARMVIGDTGYEPVIDERLSEVRFGEFSGKTWVQIRTEYPGFLEKREERKWDFRWPGGESYKDVFERVASFVSDYDLKTGIDQELAIATVAHETVNKVLVGCLSGWSPEEIMDKGHPNSVIYKVKSNQVLRLDTATSDRKWQTGMIVKGTSI